MCLMAMGLIEDRDEYHQDKIPEGLVNGTKLTLVEVIKRNRIVLFLVITSAIVNFVPFTSPSDFMIFLRSINGAPTLTYKVCRGQ